MLNRSSNERATASGGTGGPARKGSSVLRQDGSGADGGHGGDAAGDKGRLHLADRVVDTHAVAFVEDLDAVEIAGGGAVLVGGGESDIEEQDLVAVPGQGDFLEAGVCDPVLARADFVR